MALALALALLEILVEPEMVVVEVSSSLREILVCLIMLCHNKKLFLRRK